MKKSTNRTIGRRNFMKSGAQAALTAPFAAGLTPFPAAAYDRSGATPGIFRDIYRQLHIDTHFGGFREIYRTFDVEACADAFADAGFEMVSYFAKCWAGYSYYEPTVYGTVHPGLERDFTGELTRALKQRGIRTIVYFMLGMERRHQKDHPDWIRNSNAERRIFAPDAIADAAMMCFNTPYVDEIGFPQMKEIIERYDPDGFFVDIVMQQFLQSNCYCPHCRRLFKEATGGEIPTSNDDPNVFEYRRWANRRMEAHMQKMHTTLAEANPDITIINNYAWMFRYPVTPPSYVNHITWDTPTPKVGNFAWNFSLEARYVQTLPNITWSCMNTRGNNWGEYSLREPEAFLMENATLLAACGRTYLSDIPYPHGNPDPAVMEVFGAANERTAALEPYVSGCVPVRDTAVLHAADSVWSKEPLKPTPTWDIPPAYHAVAGAHKALIEGHVQMNILNSETLLGSLDGYRALVIADQPILSDRECEAIRTFVRNGGALVVTGESGTRDAKNRPLDTFALADVLGVEWNGSPDTANCYLRATPALERHGIPAMDVQVMRNYTRITPTTAKTVLEFVPPWEGIRNGTPPPALDAEGPGVTINRYGTGTAVYSAAKVFDAYLTESTPVLRKLGLWMLTLAHPANKRTVTLAGTSVNIEMFYNERGAERFIHLINYAGDKRETGTPQAQDFITAHGIEVSLELSRRPSSVMVVPDGIEIDHSWRNGRLTFTARPLEIHDVYRIT